MTKQDQEMPTKYHPQDIESKWYEYWIEGKFFEATSDETKKPYTIVIPPPNVTGKLHLGHAWDTALQDILSRLKRMQGYDTLWLPGMDHAGIATQAKVEAKLREEGKSRYDLGREAFVEKTWEWKEEYADFIRQQWAKLGLSLDYSRERFTLDEGLSKAVREVFVKLYEKGLIYRGEYIINWDPVTKTALSDIEVIYKDVQGYFYHMKYPLADGDGAIEVATTRPETMLGDTAVAVHPEDERYQHLIGKMVKLPITGREIPIVADDYVDMEFGSGAVKITPAHDPNDFEIGNRHNLPRILVMNEDGTMNEKAGQYEGMDRFECRKQIVKDLQEQGVLFKIEEHVHSVGHSERSGAVVEPYLSTQWFVKMKPLAEQAIELQTTENKVNFVPDRFEKTYLRWMENIRDWCISRQLWWGHRIPAWYHKETGEVYVGHEAPQDIDNWKQDEDVLDTWFSSALWPFSTMGWPDEEAPDYKRYYSTDALVTGYDIIFFWVSRMIFQGLEFTGQPPFKDVLIHGLVRDAEGQKMSKSLGNGVDPMEVIDKYGADALRFFLATGSSPGNDLRFYWEKVESTWNFGNKIWNASRFALMNMDGMSYDEIDLTGEKSIADQWILTRLQETIETVTRLIDAYEFGEVGRHLYNFIWDDLCDWYIEMAKLPLYGEDEVAKKTTRSVLAYVLDQTMRLLHPLMPFITEEIWQHLPHEGESITVASWPVKSEEFTFEQAMGDMELLKDIIRSVRNTRAELNVPMSKEIELHIQAKNEDVLTQLERGKHYIEKFCNPSTLVMGTAIEKPEKSMSNVLSGVELYLPLAGLLDLEEEIARLEKEENKLEKEVERVQKKLSNQGFLAKAPEKVIEEERKKEADYLEKRAAVRARIKELKG
ncbi:valine--tRNA ligase [Halalkalibacterium halodurans]|uniref:Valine--tRNA ligase n=1 Tax=Halalkalibacterium halodurans (strain ATCC BAA-125 / DSM 18197 / FERM 7344 / JCM 9153 / C-125) TaxID=272558 RepID=SYV_HALH5|nr:valine--tRNA ligase [Halalkalibacterium halodurans]Q9K8G8.1 RecName: Full=Valine--tRNA ligase; AltName: Full=Valyl-tRNA synthetase; Short=ValRS [Halalkalibacterium halodurans C-125]MED4082208.1 valine--tRNA ligase [Halalkalibacterium halodurans]MED4084515.1 valine--tRNA ligase [Halalkalibacterium halodurans]MED4103709.1 valine--tRNA ligase [Halalkalibacterium halodurans]MED4110177.1 valine--tRNA ligase [Halalkalibacterium halodurans]MED4147885.1 valine--tRNA ligase [Halalkalibacterium halo